MKPELLAEAEAISALTSTQVQLTIPSILATGETFSLRLSVIDNNGLPSTAFTNRLTFVKCEGVEGLPDTFTIDPQNSTAEIAGLTAVGPHAVSISARVDDTCKRDGDPTISANPAWVFDEPPYRIYWGDIHVHTEHSTCHWWRCKDPEWCYEYARDIALLDFAAPADHLRGIHKEPSRWPNLQRLAREYNDPGRFATFLAFESSHAKGFGGDNNVYYRDDDAEHFWVDRDDMRGIAPKVHLKEMWDFLDRQGKDYMTIPHHTGRKHKNRAFDEDYYDPAREPLFEIFSSWGSSEYRHTRFPISGGNSDDPAYFSDALKAGCRYGLMASSDDHATFPGRAFNHRVAPFEPSIIAGNAHKGLTAIRTLELTREGLFDALKSRDCYASTLARTLVDMKIGDSSMGTEMGVSKTDKLRGSRSIAVDVAPDGGCDEVTLVRNGEDLQTVKLPRESEVPGRKTVTFEDAEPLDNIAARDAKFHPDPFVAYYARISSNHDNCQWTSPIWLDLE